MLLLKEFQVQVFIFFNGLSSWDFASTKYFRRFPQNYSNQIDRNQFDLHGPLILVGAATVGSQPIPEQQHFAMVEVAENLCPQLFPDELPILAKVSWNDSKLIK